MRGFERHLKGVFTADYVSSVRSIIVDKSSNNEGTKRKGFQTTERKKKSRKNKK